MSTMRVSLIRLFDDYATFNSDTTEFRKSDQNRGLLASLMRGPSSRFWKITCAATINEQAYEIRKRTTSFDGDNMHYTTNIKFHNGTESEVSSLILNRNVGKPSTLKLLLPKDKFWCKTQHSKGLYKTYKDLKKKTKNKDMRFFTMPGIYYFTHRQPHKDPMDDLRLHSQALYHNANIDLMIYGDKNNFQIPNNLRSASDLIQVVKCGHNKFLVVYDIDMLDDPTAFSIALSRFNTL